MKIENSSLDKGNRAHYAILGYTILSLLVHNIVVDKQSKDD